ncbi:nicotinate-nicotinamide nucleotide adenylyltransferase [Vibrio ostreicida]|uniref:nicotinate-nicotinamide nucleotide adenylyltransferase n=1 Tax=Vibrio ostreicida TaxID=526588 RepID=UPI00097052F4|nr:nicotinate-nicotinamide nucleotide adenylyltransferase [Vibrio ostreicida]
MKKIAVFGSAFNPPSLGHKSVIDALGHFDRILLIPNIAHAWGKDMLDYSIRCQLVDAFIDDLGCERIGRSDVEERLYQPGESVTTFSVLTELQRLYPEDEITFVIGPDNLFKFANFYKAEQIVSRWALLTCPQKLAIRSTDIRRAINDKKEVSGLVTPKVCRLLAEKNYY